VYTPAASLAGKNIHVQAWLVPNRSDNVSSGGAAISIATGIVLFSTTIALGGPGVLNFTFGKLTALCLAIYITLADGRSATCTSWKLFHRPPPPSSGNNFTVLSVDHHTGGMLIDVWLPFAAPGLVQLAV
jgi:hypothetical protein